MWKAIPIHEIGRRNFVGQQVFDGISGLAQYVLHSDHLTAHLAQRSAQTMWQRIHNDWEEVNI